MGHDGMHFSLVSREVIADSVETVMMAERLDGSVLLAGCDKSLPGMLMAAARLDLSSVFLYAGTIMPGDDALPKGCVSIGRCTVPSGVTTERGAGSGDGEDEPMRRLAAGFFAGASGPSQPGSFTGARDRAPPSSRMME